MDEQNVGTINNNQTQTGEGNQVPNNTVPATPPVQQVTTVAVEQAKEPGFFKKHWKKIVLGGSAVLTAVGSAVVAYKKGKASGMNMVPMPGTSEEYSPLDPNVE